jgi:hypothetical protein
MVMGYRYKVDFGRSVRPRVHLVDKQRRCSCELGATCPSKHYHPGANRALPAVIFGMIGEVGEIGGLWIACPLALERVDPKDHSEVRLWHDLLLWVHSHLAPRRKMSSAARSARV